VPTCRSGNLVIPGRGTSRPGRDLVRRASTPQQDRRPHVAGYSCNNLNTNLLARRQRSVTCSAKPKMGSISRAGRGSVSSSNHHWPARSMRTLRASQPNPAVHDELFDESSFEHHLRSSPRLRSPNAGTGSASCKRRVYAQQLCVRARRSIERATAALDVAVIPSSGRIHSMTQSRGPHIRNCNPPTSGIGTGSAAAHRKQLDVGRRTAPRISRIVRRWLRRDWLASRTAPSMRCACTSRRSGHPQQALSRTRVGP